MNRLRVLAADQRWLSLLCDSLSPRFSICLAGEPVDAIVIAAGSAGEMAQISGELVTLLSRSPGAALVVCCPRECEKALPAALRGVVRDRLDLPFAPADLVTRMGALLEAAGGGNPSGLQRIVGASRSVREIRTYILKAAAAETTILITGETGTGKELVAESIHQYSPRRRARLVTVNCAAIPDSLLESELFGYERGAFTGADATHEGKLQQAENGTVYLDEIGEMTRFAQAKLLRVLESREIYRLGGRSRLSLNVRFVAATNQPLEDLVERGEFRKDLFYRLNVGRVQLPPLRERPEDVPPLLDHFIAYYNPRFGRNVRGASAELHQILTGYHWPGNVRELRNLVESMYLEGATGPLTPSDLPSFFRCPPAPQHAAAGEREALLHALHVTNWNKSRAAEQLKWSRMTLYRKIVKYGLQKAATAEAADVRL